MSILKRSEPRAGDTAADFLVVGLGNPGAEYEGTRHNVGAEAVALLVGRSGGSLSSEKGTHAVLARLRGPSRFVVAAVPQTYMNESGLAVGALVKRFKITDLGTLLVVHDELDLPSGRVKVKAGGGTAGHNGLKSIVNHVHGQGFIRIRIGIGKPPGRQPGADFVLRRPGSAERKTLEVAEEVAADALECVMELGVDAAMNRFNTET